MVEFAAVANTLASDVRMLALCYEHLVRVAPRRHARGIVKLTKSSSIDPQDTGLQPVANPPCWAPKTAASLNLTGPNGAIRDRQNGKPG